MALPEYLFMSVEDYLALDNNSHDATLYRGMDLQATRQQTKRKRANNQGNI